MAGSGFLGYKHQAFGFQRCEFVLSIDWMTWDTAWSAAFIPRAAAGRGANAKKRCGNQQRCLHFRLLLEDPFEQLFGIVKNVDRHGKPALFLIMTDSCLKIIQAKIKVVRRRKSVNNATISYTLVAMKPG